MPVMWHFKIIVYHPLISPNLILQYNDLVPTRKIESDSFFPHVFYEPFRFKAVLFTFSLAIHHTA